jgi:hypothetical protein
MRVAYNHEEMLADIEARYSGKWYLTRWWRVIAPDGSLWAESSDSQEMLEAMRPGDRLQQLWAREDKEWRDVPLDLGSKIC